MRQYPSIDEIFPSHDHERLALLGHDEIRRQVIASSAGLEMLALSDQYARAIYELGIDNQTDAGIAHQEIEAAVTMFHLRGVPRGQSLTPSQIRSGLRRIASNLREIQNDLNSLMVARRDFGIGESVRNSSLEQIQLTMLGSIAANILPSSLTNKFTDEDIADAMPIVFQTEGSLGFTNTWAGGFNRVAKVADDLADAFEPLDLSKPTRAHDLNLVQFIGCLGEIFTHWTGQKARSPERNANQAVDWRGPFSRFVEAVWPLTPDASGTIGENRRCPTNKVIRGALNQSALLSRHTTSQ